MPKVDRLTRVNELVKRELAESLEKFPVSPAGVLASISFVNCSVDLRNATVGVSVLGGGEEERHEVISNLRRFRAELQRILGRNLSFKHTPVLNFELDDRIAKGDAVLELLSRADEEKDIH